MNSRNGFRYWGIACHATTCLNADLNSNAPPEINFGQIKIKMPWWRHQTETFSALLPICAGNSPVTGEFPTQRQVTRSFEVFFDLHWINGRVNNREAGDLRRDRPHHDVTVMPYFQLNPWKNHINPDQATQIYFQDNAYECRLQNIDHLSGLNNLMMVPWHGNIFHVTGPS